MTEEKRSTINVRLGETLLQAIRERAAGNANSMNAEIVQRLEASLSGNAIPDVTPTAGLDVDERSLVRMWRAMNEGERGALAAVAERLAENASNDAWSLGRGGLQIKDENLREIHDRQEVVLLGIWRSMSRPQRSRLLALMESLIDPNAA